MSRALGRRGDAGQGGGILFALLLLAACTSSDPSTFERVTPAQPWIRIDHPDFDAELTVRSLRRDPSTDNVWRVAELHGDRALGVIVASDMQRGYQVIDRPTEQWVRSIIGPEHRIAWGADGRTAALAGQARYRLFRMGSERGATLGCVGFSRSAPDNAEQRDVAFGYLCRYGSRSLEPADARELLESVTLVRPGSSAGSAFPADSRSPPSPTTAA